MAGTKDGGKAAAETNKIRYGKDFYARIGAIGGKKGNTGGFATQSDCTNPNCGYPFDMSHRVAQCAGYKGGTISRRTKKTL